MLESSMAAGILRTCRGSHVKFPLSSLARKHSRYSYITLCVLNNHLDLACVRKWIWTEGCWLCLVIAWRRWKKVDLLWSFCQYLQYITDLLATEFVIPAANNPPVLFQPCFSFHTCSFSLHLCPPYPSFPAYFKSSQGNSTSQ